MHTVATNHLRNIDFLMEWDPANCDNQSPIAVARLLVLGHTGHINAGGKYTDWRGLFLQQRIAMMPTLSLQVEPEALFTIIFGCRQWSQSWYHDNTLVSVLIQRTFETVLSTFPHSLHSSPLRVRYGVSFINSTSYLKIGSNMIYLKSDTIKK